jgi:predicted RNA-binding Zn-ribbon protein involved in translation (DUF1610 family)
MGDFITLTCPSCGGKLQVSPNTSVLNCRHCGTEHLVRRSADGVSLESFARCPKCGRNDRVEKVSAILKSHSQEVTTTEIRTEKYYDQNGNPQTRTIEVPVTHTQVSGLARSFVSPGNKPKPLPKPESLPKPDSLPRPNNLPKPVITNPNTEKRNLLVIGSISLFLSTILLVITIIIGSNDKDLTCCVPIPIISLLAGTIVLVLGILKKSLDNSEIEVLNKENERKLAEWQEKNEQIILAWNEENQRSIEEWQNKNNQLLRDWKDYNWLIEESWRKAMNNWDNLYYCHRDDCVFVQGDDNCAPTEEMESYLYKDLPKPRNTPIITARIQQRQNQSLGVNKDRGRVSDPTLDDIPPPS